MLAQGKGMRAIARESGVARATVEKLSATWDGCAASTRTGASGTCRASDSPSTRCGRFVYAKQPNVEGARKPPPSAGDIWTWFALCTDTQIIPTWRVGQRSAAAGVSFVNDLASRLRHQMQITADGRGVHLEAVAPAYGAEIDADTVARVFGINEPDTSLERLSTPYVERKHLTMRMTLRRFTTEATGFSKSLDMHLHALALHFMVHNYLSVYGPRRVTPAMAAGVADRVWEVEDLIGLLEEHEAGQLRPRHRAMTA